MDDIPVYNKDNVGTYSFSGSRIHRGMYQSKDGILMNADINASLNIIRKCTGNDVFHNVNVLSYTKNIQIWNFNDFYPAKRKQLFKAVA